MAGDDLLSDLCSAAGVTAVDSSGRLRKARVVRRHKGGCAGIGFGKRDDAAQPQLLDEAILQRQVRTLDTSLGKSSQLHSI